MIVYLILMQQQINTYNILIGGEPLVLPNFYSISHTELYELIDMLFDNIQHDPNCRNVIINIINTLSYSTPNKNNELSSLEYWSIIHKLFIDIANNLPIISIMITHHTDKIIKLNHADYLELIHTTIDNIQHNNQCFSLLSRFISYGNDIMEKCPSDIYWKFIFELMDNIQDIYYCTSLQYVLTQQQITELDNNDFAELICIFIDNIQNNVHWIRIFNNLISRHVIKITQIPDAKYWNIVNILFNNINNNNYGQILSSLIFNNITKINMMDNSAFINLINKLIDNDTPTNLCYNILNRMCTNCPTKFTDIPRAEFWKIFEKLLSHIQNNNARYTSVISNIIINCQIIIKELKHHVFMNLIDRLSANNLYTICTYYPNKYNEMSTSEFIKFLNKFIDVDNNGLLGGLIKHSFNNIYKLSDMDLFNMLIKLYNKCTRNNYYIGNSIALIIQTHFNKINDLPKLLKVLLLKKIIKVQHNSSAYANIHDGGLIASNIDIMKEVFDGLKPTHIQKFIIDRLSIIGSNTPYADFIEKYLIKHKEIITKKCRGGWGLLLRAIKDRRNIALIKLLLKLGAGVNTKNNTGQTPVLYAVKNRDKDMLLLLLKAGADPDQCNYQKETPLIWAARYCNEEIVKILLNYKARINDTNKKLMTPLLNAARYNRSIGVLRILLDHCADKDATDNEGNTALHLVAKYNYDELKIRLLMDTDIDPLTRNNNGQTASHLGMWFVIKWKRDMAILNVLLEAEKERIDELKEKKEFVDYRLYALTDMYQHVSPNIVVPKWI